VIRAATVTALSALLVLVLYLPAAHPPAHFLGQLRAEQRAVATFWGEAAAIAMLAGAVGMHDAASAASPSRAQAPNPANAPVAQAFDTIGQRLFDNGYTRSIEALLLLAAFRAALLAHWLGALSIVAVALAVDGQVSRLTRAREFRLHDPERFALCISAAIVLACATTLALVWPVPLHPLLLPCTPLVIALLLSRALANFHRQG
jgi:hypothetical protein